MKEMTSLQRIVYAGHVMALGLVDFDRCSLLDFIS